MLRRLGCDGLRVELRSDSPAGMLAPPEHGSQFPSLLYPWCPAHSWASVILTEVGHEGPRVIGSDLVGKEDANRAMVLEPRKSLWDDSVEPFPFWKEFLTKEQMAFPPDSVLRKPSGQVLDQRSGRPAPQGHSGPALP